VVISYQLATDAASVLLEIVDPATGDTVRQYSSDDPQDVPVEGRNIPDYWLGTSPRLSKTSGLHRFVWDVRYPPPAVERFAYEIAAVPGPHPSLPRASTSCRHLSGAADGGRAVVSAGACRQDRSARQDVARRSGCAVQAVADG
jgi:hypothetical protein